MHRLGTGAAGYVEDPLLVQVTLGRGSRTDEVRLVCEGCVERCPIGLRVDRDRHDLELAKRAADANGDLASVGDEDLPEDRHLPRILLGGEVRRAADPGASRRRAEPDELIVINAGNRIARLRLG